MASVGGSSVSLGFNDLLDKVKGVRVHGSLHTHTYTHTHTHTSQDKDDPRGSLRQRGNQI